MIVNVVADFAEQDSFGLQHSMRLLQEWRIGVRETVPVLLCRSKHQAKTDIEILRLVSPLIWNMRWIIYHYIEDVILKRHAGVVTNEAGMMLRFQVQSNDRASATSPESASIHGGIKYPPRFFVRVKVEHLLQQLGVFSIPCGG
jgi:hypothetical protein